MDRLDLSDIVGATLFITINDDRALTGTLVAVDAQANLLVDNVDEYCNTYTRTLGLVSVPFNTIQSVNIKSAQLDTLVHQKKAFLERIV